MALGLSAKQNAADLCVPPLYVHGGVTVDEENIARTTRVNVDYADDWKDLPWRFFVRNNAFVSKASLQRKTNIPAVPKDSRNTVFSM
jgi:DNA-3-methyladenine glycosylase